MPPKGGGKRRALGASKLTEQLEQWRMDPEGNPEFKQLASEAFERAQKSYGFDHSAKTTQNRRQHHLKEYELFLEGVAKKEGKPFNDAYLWGEDNVETNLRTYLAFAAAVVKPRSYRSESIKFQSLVQRRQSLIYWMQRRCADNINRGKLWNASSEALHHSYRSLGLSAQATEKYYLTKYDLANLIEHDMWATPAPDVAQQHHLCWLFGFVCGVRPGTIGFARQRQDQYLQWKDVKIRRSGNPGSKNFQASITFRWLKGYRDEVRRPLTFTCAGPIFPEDVMYSIPHRLLAILLRRNLLKDHTTVESLLSGEEIVIALVDNASDMPVIEASIPKGTSLISGRPASCDAISAYVQRRALDYGLPAGITHYAWRRSAGTRMAEAKGPDKAREMLGHEVTSRTFETAYNQGIVAMDAFSIAMGRDAVNSEVLLEDESLATNRIKTATQSKERWIERYVFDDPDYQAQVLACNAAEAEAEEDPDDEAKTKTAQDEKTKLHSFRRTLRTQGRIAFQDVELRLTEANITQTELAKRREEVKQGGHLQKMLLEAAAGVARKQKQQVGETDAADDADTYAADDLQDARDQQGDEVVVNNFSTETNADETVTTQPDVPAACATLMDVLVSQEDIDKSEKSCRLCQADDTVDSTKQAALYKPGQLNQHLGTDFHSPRKRFLRKHKAKAVCPYGCGKKFTGSKLLAHVWKDIEQSDQHLLAAAKDGLFARDFNPSANRISSAVTRVVDGEAKKIEAGDPNTVPLKAVVRAENIDRSSGNVMERSLVGTHTEKPVLRLPTANPVSEGPWWHGHDDGIYGDVADTLQQQRTWIADQLDANLRRLGHGRADESGTTRQNPFQSERKTKGIATLRKRLQEELSWAWAEDHDHVEQPDDDAEEGDNEEGDGDGSDDDGA